MAGWPRAASHDGSHFICFPLSPHPEAWTLQPFHHIQRSQQCPEHTRCGALQAHTLQSCTRQLQWGLAPSSAAAVPFTPLCSSALALTAVSCAHLYPAGPCLFGHSQGCPACTPHSCSQSRSAHTHFLKNLVCKLTVSLSSL